MSDKLLPCPFCGGEAHNDSASCWNPEEEEWIPNFWHRVICKNCGTQTKAFYTEAEAIEAWDRRTEREWIPMTERLPKTNGCYLVWRPHFFGGKIGMPAICYFDGQNTWHDAYGVDFSRVLHEKDITAWMPLPESYRGE